MFSKKGQNLTKKISLNDKYILEGRQNLSYRNSSSCKASNNSKDLDEKNDLNTGGFISGYKGSPLGGYDLELFRAKKYLDEKSIYHQPGLNEELGATAVWGSQQGEFKDRGNKDGVFESGMEKAQEWIEQWMYSSMLMQLAHQNLVVF